MFTDQVKTEQLLAVKFFQCSMSEGKREREKTKEKERTHCHLQTSKLLVLNYDFRLYLNPFMSFFCLENHGVEDRRIKGSRAVHSDRMIRTTDVNKKSSQHCTLAQKQVGGRAREEEIFVSCNMLKPSNKWLGVSPFSPPLVFLASEVQ